MSYQPFPASGSTPAPAPSGRRNPVLLVVGIVVLVAGVVGGLILIISASSSAEDSVKKLARAPAGCTTTLQFDDPGTFLVFFERQGTISGLDGDCSNDGSFKSDSDEVPDQTLTLVDADDNEVNIDDASGASYDAGGFAGEQIGEVKIDDAGEFRLTVTPDDDNNTSYAIAVGKDPTANEGTLRIAGIAVLAAGVVLGVLLILLGLRKRGGGPTGTPAPAVPGAWTPAATPPASWPPAAPAPSYGAPPPSSVPTYGSPGPAPPTFGAPTAPWSSDDPTRPQPPPDPFSRPPGG